MESEQPQPPQQVHVKKATSAPSSTAAHREVGFWEKYGNRILLALTVVALLYALVQYRRTAALRAAESASDSLIAAREKVNQFRTTDVLRFPPEQIAQEAASLESSALPALDSVINDADQTKLHGQALVTRGDLYWTLANLPEAPGAATQPSLRVGKTKDEYLKSAENAYKRAADQKADPISATVARFGLAAIAENRGKWDEAKSIYDAIAADETVLPSLKTQATFRAAQVADLRNPLFTTPATQPTTAATTVPTGTTLPATAPVATTLPTTRP